MVLIQLDKIQEEIDFYLNIYDASLPKAHLEVVEKELWFLYRLRADCIQNNKMSITETASRIIDKRLNMEQSDATPMKDDTDGELDMEYFRRKHVLLMETEHALMAEGNRSQHTYNLMENLLNIENHLLSFGMKKEGLLEALHHELLSLHFQAMDYMVVFPFYHVNTAGNEQMAVIRIEGIIQIKLFEELNGFHVDSAVHRIYVNEERVLLE